MSKLSVIITTRNEEKNIKDCLNSVVSWVDEIILVDDNSSDKTVEIAREFEKVKIFIREMKDGFGPQKNFALSKATSEWILSIDADERIGEDLKEEIIQKIQNSEYDGYLLRRVNYVFGELWDDGKAMNLRLFKREKGIFSDASVHEKVILDGRVGYLNSPLYHYSDSLSTVKNYINIYLNDYTDKTASDLYKTGKRITKINVFYFFIIKPFIIFIWKYLIKKYFKRGIRGLIMAEFVAIAYLISYIKLWELQRGNAPKNK